MPLRTLLYLKELHQLRRDIHLSISQLERIQYRKLKLLVNYAYNNVSYYRKLFAWAGISPEDIKTKSDISKIPITTKSQIQSLSREEITKKSTNIKNCLNFKTSGSTGGPLNILLSEKEYIAAGLFYLRRKKKDGFST